MGTSFTKSKFAGIITATLLAVVLASCSDSKQESEPTTGLLSGVCPDTVKILTDWFPEAEHGGTFEMLGDNYVVDKDEGSVTGDLRDRGTDTGVDLKILVGGFLEGGLRIAAEMYTDDSITLGYINTDSAVRDSTDLPTVAVFAPLDKSPLGFMWDADRNPGAQTLQDALKNIDTVSVFGRLAFVEYLVSEGVLPESKLDLNYKGDLQIASRNVIHQGFETTEPYLYEQLHGIKVNFETLYDLGWPIYPETLAVRRDSVQELDECLKLLVPIMQRAQIDFMNEPSRTLQIIADANSQFDTWWKYDVDAGEYSIGVQKQTGVVKRGSGTFGEMDPGRVQSIIDKAAPVFRTTGKEVPSTLSASDLIDNSYLDPTITYP